MLLNKFFNYLFPSDVDDIIWINLLFCFILLYGFMSFSVNYCNVQNVNSFTHTTEDSIIMPADSNFTFSPFGKIKLDYEQYYNFRIDLINQNNRIMKVATWIYFLVIPLFNFFCLVFGYLRGLLYTPKDLYTRIFFKYRGVNNVS